MLQPSYSACSKVIAALGHGNRPHLVAAYHAATTTAQEKACAVEEAMGLGRLPRGEYGIVKSLVLTHPGAERPFLCAYDSSDKLDFRVIGGALHAPSRVYAYPRERLEQLVGVSAGAVSPLVDPSGLSGVYFDTSLLEAADQRRDKMWDFPLSLCSSLLANPRDVYDALRALDSRKYAELTMRPWDFGE
ncbi:TPA: hypothetical protein HA295_00370 [Candidatus Woesearchaeota archaeon]|nr:hypothetical protein [Candidatus Woesearchaeota archaeon]